LLLQPYHNILKYRKTKLQKKSHQCERKRQRVEQIYEKQGNNRIVLNCLILKSCDLILTVRAWPTMPLAFMSRDKSRHSSSQISVHKKQVGYGSASIRIIFKSWLRIRITVKIKEAMRLKTEPWRATDAHN
jgi:hypothetical protein